MSLIDEPYVSDFLVETNRENNFKIVATPQATQLTPDLSLKWVTEENAISIKKKTAYPFIY